MKLAIVKVRVIEEADAATLETSINTFLASGAQRTYIDIKLVLGANYVALISFTE